MKPGEKLITNYAKTVIDDSLAVKSIVTVHHINLMKSQGEGEAHNFWELLYVDKGFMQVFVDGELYQLEAGQMIMYAPGAYHCGPRNDAQLGIVSFESDSENMNYFANKCLTLNSNQRELLSQIISSGEELFRPVPSQLGLLGQMPHEGVDSYQLQKLKNLLEVLLIELHQTGNMHSAKQETIKAAKPAGTAASNRNKQKQQLFEAITAYMREHLRDTLSLGELSEKFGISLSCLKLLFKEQSGCGPITYFNALKIAKAKCLIRETTLNMTEISEQLGFSSVHYFSRLFKKVTGKSPMTFAKALCKG